MFVFVGLRVLSQQKNPKDTELGILVVFFEPFRLSATKTTIRGNAEINCRVLKNQLECPSNFGLPRRQPPEHVMQYISHFNITDLCFHFHMLAKNGSI